MTNLSEKTDAKEALRNAQGDKTEMLAPLMHPRKVYRPKDILTTMFGILLH